MFGYNPNATKTYLVIKDKYAAVAKCAFAGTSISITTNGQRHLGAEIGPWEYTEHYITSKVQVWRDEIKRLPEVAETFPHAAYAAFTHGFSSHWLYIMHTIPDIQGLLQPLEEAIHQFFIPALFGCPPCSSMARDLYALPVRLGGLGLVNPCKAAVFGFNASVQLTSPLSLLLSHNVLIRLFIRLK